MVTGAGGGTTDDAVCLIKREVQRLHTTEREKVTDEGGVTVTERKRVAPRAKDIELVSQGMFYLPDLVVERGASRAHNQRRDRKDRSARTITSSDLGPGRPTAS